MTQLKSLAHPEWPYAGTVHEWRGFVKASKAEKPIADHTYIWSDYTQQWEKGSYYQKQNFGPELD